MIEIGDIVTRLKCTLESLEVRHGDPAYAFTRLMIKDAIETILRLNVANNHGVSDEVEASVHVFAAECIAITIAACEGEGWSARCRDIGLNGKLGVCADAIGHNGIESKVAYMMSVDGMVRLQRAFQ